MTKRSDFDKLSSEESGLKSHWYDVLKHIKKDLAYIWSKPVKKDIESMQEELEKIKYILKRLSSYYKRTDKHIFKQELLDINSLVSFLNKVEPSKEWVKGAHESLKQVVADFEKNKVDLRQYQGDLHVHSQDSLDGIPISGSNCGGLAVAEIIWYAGTRMGQNFVAITDHSRDADVEEALKYWEPKGRPEVAKYGDERIKAVYENIDAIKRPPLKVFKGIEINLLPNGEFDSDLPASSQIQCVNCSIHPNLNRKGFPFPIEDIFSSLPESPLGIGLLFQTAKFHLL